MGPAIGWLSARPQPRVIVLALIGFGVAGCSAQPMAFNGDASSSASSAITAHQTFGRSPVPPEPIPASGGGGEVAGGADVRGAPPDRRPSKIARPANKSPLKVANAKPKQKSAPEREAAAPAVAQRAPAPKPTAAAPADDAIKTEAVPQFRWPVRGQVIAGFGPKADGGRNDGIDIAVPESTPIRAADDGVVIYSGNQLKAFGNLVLVRHNNNYVTAYAHAKELRVKQGDQIKAGEVIATAGQTGNVGVPELHFEIRQGSSPVDPTRLLHGG